MSMKNCSKPGFLLGILAVVAIVVAPAAAWAGTPGGGSNTSAGAYSCKSGAKVKNAKACKENGGTR
ncbi:MAG: hypothetical protein WC670_20330 [Pseudolabrys sp.]